MDADQIRRYLKGLIDDRGTTMKDVSLRLGRSHSYVQQFIERGTPRALKDEDREKLAELFDVEASSFRPYGKTQNHQLREIEAPYSGPTMSNVVELDVRASAGPGLNIEQEAVVAEWSMPRSLIEAHTHTQPSGLRIVTVYGDSMEPTYHPGQRVMVDPEDRSPSPPGIFIVWDGLGLVLKRVEVIPQTEPVRVRLMSDNDHYTPYEVTLDEAYIQGRVIGGWKWT